MANETEKTVDVELNDGRTIQIIVRKPSNAVMSAAQRKGALVWTQCIQEGVMTKKELEKVLEDRGIWTKAKAQEQANILKAISELEKKLYLSRGVTLKTSEGRDLLAEKVSLEQNTAESLSDNAKFDYIVSQCTFDINELPVYNSIDDYSNRSDDPIAFAAASALAAMLYSLDKDFEMKLPENKFLAKFDYINDDLHLVNKEGNKVDTEGRLVNDLGQFINEEGKRVDIDGNLLDEDGAYIPTTEFEVDDKPKPKTRRRSTKKKETTETADSTDS